MSFKRGKFMDNFNRRNDSVDFDRAVSLGNGVWWVGFQDRDSGLRCNPYLIIEGDEAILIDGGSRPDFPVVMMKILETGLDPRNISGLIYTHFDPDLCGSIPNLEEMISSSTLRVISADISKMFLHHYGSRSKFESIRKLGNLFTFKTGRTLEFIPVPHCHSPGSFAVYDRQSRVLFSSDLFGTYDKSWQLFLGLPDGCRQCDPCTMCKDNHLTCQIHGYLAFHRTIMPCSRAVHLAMEKLRQVPFEIVASQHGSIIDRGSAEILMRELLKLNDIGIDKLEPEETKNEIIEAAG